MNDNTRGCPPGETSRKIHGIAACLVLIFGAGACYDGAEFQGGDSAGYEGWSVDDEDETPLAHREIGEALAEASAAFDVPIPVLRTLAANMNPQEVSDGAPALVGILGLREGQLELGAEISQFSAEEVADDLRAGILAGAAVLSNIADDLELDRADVDAWVPAQVAYDGGALDYTLLDLSLEVRSPSQAPLTPAGLWKTVPRPGPCPQDRQLYIGSGALSPTEHIVESELLWEEAEGLTVSEYRRASAYTLYHRFDVCSSGEHYDVYYRDAVRTSCHRISTSEDDRVSSSFTTGWHVEGDEKGSTCPSD